MKLLKDSVPISFSAKYLGLSRSSYYHWAQGKVTVTLKSKAKICSLIRQIFANSKGTYGSPRVFYELKKQSVRVSENTVAKYMQEMGLDARLKKRFKVMTTDSNHNNPIAPRLFKTEEEQCLPSSPGEVLAGDITYLKMSKKFIYLAVVLDLYNREVVGWSMGDTLEEKLVSDALKNAMIRTPKDVRIIFHSDRGSQYASHAYRELLLNKGILPSMSRRGNCYDNAYVESWFASLKKEWIYRHDVQTADQMRGLVFEYIETWYNTRRQHSALEYLSPREYKLKQNIA